MTRVFTAALIAMAGLTTLAGATHAAVITDTYTLNSLVGSGIGGVAPGGSGTLSLTFDDSALNNGSGLVSPLDGSLSALTLTFGTTTFTLAQDVNAPINPNVTVLTDVPDFVTFTPPGYTFTASLTGTPVFSLVNSAGGVVLSNAVPEPAAVALLGVGLLGLSLIRRRA